MRRSIILCMALCLIAQILPAQAITWAKKIDHGDGTNGSGITHDVHVDALNNTIVGGWGGATTDFGGGYTFTDPGTNGYIAKYGPQGNLQWARRLFATSGSTIEEITTDASGNIYFGTSWAWIDQNFWGIIVPGLPVQHIGGILGKMDPNGNMLWVESFPCDDDARVSDVITASNGDVIMTMVFSGNVTVGGQTYTSVGTADLLVARFDPNGSLVWATQINGEFQLYASTSLDLSIDASDNLVMSVYLFGTATFGGQSWTSSGPYSSLVLKLNPSGNLVWGQAITEGASFPYGVGTDAAGNIYTAGTFRDSVQINGTWYYTPNALPDNYFVKFSPNGAYSWVEVGGSTGQDYLYDMVVKPNGEFFVTGKISGNATYGQVAVNTVNSSSTYYVLKGDANGNFLWGESWGHPVNGFTNNGAPYSISVDQSGNPVIGGAFRGSYHFNGIVLTSTGTNTSDGFVARIQDNSNLITGMTYRDFNQNGMVEVGETGLPEVVVEMTPGPRYFWTDRDGEYYAGTGTGNYSLSIPNPPLYHTVTAPSTHSANFAGLGAVDSLNDFGLYPIPNIKDLRISLDGYRPPRPGDTVYYRIQVKNVGTDTVTPEVAYLPDPALIYIGGTPLFQSTLNDTLFWTLPPLAPQDYDQVILAYRVPVLPNIALGDSLDHYAHVGPLASDTTPGDNVAQLQEIVVGAYDPNDKAVSPAGDLDPATVAAGMWLEYKIRFQNTGTDTAFQVIVRDTLDSNLNIPTLEMISASHDYDLAMDGSGNLAWRFNNIMLPDSNVNEPASHGFIRYRIRPKTNLGIGSTIENTAHIYFDYNPAIVTNTTVSTVQVSTAAIDPGFSELAVQVYPNPNQGRFQIALEATQPGPLSIRLYDLQGRKLYQQELRHGAGRFEREVDVTALSQGVYLLELDNGQGRFRQRVVVR